MATVADQNLIVNNKLMKTAANSTPQKVQRNSVKPYSGRLTRSMTRGGYVKKKQVGMQAVVHPDTKPKN